MRKIVEGKKSNSIRNQRALAEAYVKDHFKEYKLLEFQDDGYTGTNFDRPGVTALLKEVKDGKIDCIVVKDFSRFPGIILSLAVT